MLCYLRESSLPPQWDIPSKGQGILSSSGSKSSYTSNVKISQPYELFVCFLLLILLAQVLDNPRTYIQAKFSTTKHETHYALARS